MSYSKKIFIGLVMVFAAVTTRAGFLLSGNTAGFFQPVSGTNVTTTNSIDGLDASFRSGVPVDNSFRSGIKFNGHEFENVENGDTFSFGLFTYYNGLSRVGTSSATSLLDLYLNFDDPALGKVHLTTITFGIDATVNTAAHLSPDIFTANFLQPSPIWVGDELVKFTINGLSKSTLVAENTFTDLASITVTVLIPEASTFTAILGIATLGFTLLCRRCVFSAVAR
jgi:hypothetical protein